MAEVNIEKQEDFDKALKKFRMQCKKEGIISEYRERQYYTKPSQKRRKNTKNKKGKEGFLVGHSAHTAHSSRHSSWWHRWHFSAAFDRY